MARDNRELSVWTNGVRVGTWRWPARKATEFEYDEAWMSRDDARPLSLSLPLPAESIPHTGTSVEAWFDNLLPDSENIRKRIQERFQTKSRTPFDLLSAVGRDCVGAIQLLPIDEEPSSVETIEAISLSDRQIEDDLAAVVSPKTFGVDATEFRISIAGAQEKTAFLKKNGKWCRPLGSTPTTHIFKLPLGLVANGQADMSTSVENEWLSARIAAQFGLPIANCEIEQFGAQKVLVVERFDRVLHSSGKFWLRLMQEDMCQATGLPNFKKYQSDGGPGVVEIARILDASVERKADLEALFKSQILFYLLAAPDGHAKNFSIRVLPRGAYRSTPLYDVLSAWPVIGSRARQIPLQKIKLAMALPGSSGWHYKVKEVQRRHFDELAKRLRLSAQAGKIVADFVGDTPRVIDAVQRGLPRGFPQPLLDSILDGMRKQARLLGN
ncbi:MAG: type II toxin-antitoxin system HipA family toxin [Steroidobacteraceae bacterium]|nr:type II toxin-antitoxin system HipA family toxin [Steroidobacteraceae bacterium]